jgi:hypothetical protein
MPIVIMSEEEDEWRWGLDVNGRFTVKSIYVLLGMVFPLESVFNEQQLRVLNNIWKSPVPSKVIAFSWKALRKRIPTRANLVLWGIVVNGGVTNCVHCDRMEEDVVHLLLFCDFAAMVWRAIFRWLVK